MMLVEGFTEDERLASNQQTGPWGPTDGSTSAHSTFTSIEALTFDLAPSVLSSPRPAAPPPALLAPS
jgi:hypothetical protein